MHKVQYWPDAIHEKWQQGWISNSSEAAQKLGSWQWHQSTMKKMEVIAFYHLANFVKNLWKDWKEKEQRGILGTSKRAPGIFSEEFGIGLALWK